MIEVEPALKQKAEMQLSWKTLKMLKMNNGIQLGVGVSSDKGAWNIVTCKGKRKGKAAHGKDSTSSAAS